MNALSRLTREPALIVGVVTAGIGLAVVFGLTLTDEQVGAILTFLGTIMALVRFLTTPNGEVVVQQRPDGAVVAGQAAAAATGTELATDPGDPDADDAPTIVQPIRLKPAA